jgi:hypothetical protein
MAVDQRRYEIRLHAAFAGANNTVDRLIMERQVDGEWGAFDVAATMPAFQMTVASALLCQLTQLRVHTRRAGVGLTSCDATYVLMADGEFAIASIESEFDVQVGSGQVDDALADRVRAKMAAGPVDRNLTDFHHRVTLNWS